MIKEKVNLQIVFEHRLAEQAYSYARNYVCDVHSVLFVDTEYAGIEIK